MENISKHITYSEAVKSAAGIRLGIKNVPTTKELSRMKVLAEKVFEPLREKLGVPISLVSFYRSVALNKAVGGATNSQHLAGATTSKNEAAMDIDADSSKTTNNEVFKYIKDNLVFDQLIAEFENEDGDGPAWIHVSYADVNRKQILIAHKVAGKTKYSPYTKELYKKIYG
jgi:zinc D-Ala-D-Ala carboxypeptidase